ncbi:hypothetical protein FH972_023017 [Carpinus fangiana]|uniref:Fungal lipase-type domain-containing protein n=1 Tax=Carpinus fangiana TaxID=176857 RepID=A0A5N6KW76_9ROSI|nr:hypothetical protein FH972_023017 [Carpinus fangiana]
MGSTFSISSRSQCTTDTRSKFNKHFKCSVISIYAGPSGYDSAYNHQLDDVGTLSCLVYTYPCIIIQGLGIATMACSSRNIPYLPAEVIDMIIDHLTFCPIHPHENLSSPCIYLVKPANMFRLRLVNHAFNSRLVRALFYSLKLGHIDHGGRAPLFKLTGEPLFLEEGLTDNPATRLQLLAKSSTPGPRPGTRIESGLAHHIVHLRITLCPVLQREREVTPSEYFKQLRSRIPILLSPLIYLESLHIDASYLGLVAQESDSRTTSTAPASGQPGGSPIFVCRPQLRASLLLHECFSAIIDGVRDAHLGNLEDLEIGIPYEGGYGDFFEREGRARLINGALTRGAPKLQRASVKLFNQIGDWTIMPHATLLALLSQESIRKPHDLHPVWSPNIRHDGLCSSSSLFICLSSAENDQVNFRLKVARKSPEGKQRVCLSGGACFESARSWRYNEDEFIRGEDLAINAELLLTWIACSRDQVLRSLSATELGYCPGSVGLYAERTIRFWQLALHNENATLIVLTTSYLPTANAVVAIGSRATIFSEKSTSGGYGRFLHNMAEVSKSGDFIVVPVKFDTYPRAWSPATHLHKEEPSPTTTMRITIGLSLLLAALTAASAVPASQAAPSKTPVSAALYAKFQRYTLFSAAAYANKCGKPPSGAAVVKYFNVSSTDTQATLFRDDAAKEFILSFRGTSNPNDFKTDQMTNLVPITGAKGVNCAKCTVHEGVHKAWLSVQDSVISTLKTGLAAHSGYTVTVTGHSLGGALASQGGASLRTVFGAKVLKAVYSLGEFRNGNAAYANYIDSLFPPSAASGVSYYRLTHTKDGVPNIIPVGTYRHSATEYWESKDPTTAATTFKCLGQEPQDCNNGAGGSGINIEHLCYSNYSIGNPAEAGAGVCSGKPAPCQTPK